MNSTLGQLVCLNPMALRAQQADWQARLHGMTGLAAEQALREALIQGMQALGLEMVRDRAGNLLGSLRSRSDGGRQPAVMMGCHLDVAAPLGGATGALAGLAVVRAYREAGQWPLRTLTVAAFTHTLGGLLPPQLVGAQVFAGQQRVEATLAKHLASLGWQGEHTPGEVTPYEYLEWQASPQLQAPSTLALVDHLQAVSGLMLRLPGLTAAHAGQIRQALMQQVVGPVSRSWGVRAECLPAPELGDGPHPEGPGCRLDWLGADDTTLQQAVEAFVPQAQAWAHAQGLTLVVTPLDSCDAAPVDTALSQAIREAAQRQGLRVLPTACPTGWDTLALARQTPCALVHSNPEDLVNTTEVLLKVVRQRAGVLPPPQMRRSPQWRGSHRNHAPDTPANPARSRLEALALAQDAL